MCVLLCALVCAPIFAQTPERGRHDQTDVLRVYTELVQTDVMVFDKQGRFVDGLKKEDFELRIDGQPKPIDFFERITAGSANEESQLAAARGTANRTGNANPTAPVPLDRGRPIFFYLDDLHLDLASLKAGKKLISNFIDKQMGQNDEVAITSASGQIGFLQQLTNNKTVLRAALERLNVHPYFVRDMERPPMTEYQALLIESFDRDTTSYFIDETIRQNLGMTAESAEIEVRNRARVMLQQADNVTMATLGGLDSLVRSANKLPGRKLIFFISGGFFLNPHENSMNRLQRITSAAAKSDVVIYSLDARGLVSGLPDASSDAGFDVSGRLEHSKMGELAASQDTLNALARDTGGRAVFNTNALGVGLTRALKETSAYYLLAWKPEGETQHASKFHRIEVKVIGHPQLTVQVRRGFFDVEPEVAAAKPSKAKPPASVPAAKTEEPDLRQKLGTTFPERAIPISLNLNYVNTSDKGWMLSTMMEVPSSFLTFEDVGGKQVAAVDVAGVFYNDHGQTGSSFTKRVTVETQASDAPGRGVVRYSYQIFLPPGLYQVRVGARDAKSGRIGSANGWVEIPNLKATQLGLSSVLVGVRPSSAVNTTSETSQTLTSSLELSISHRFQHNSNLRFVIFIYNARLAPPPESKADIALQVQFIRDDQPVVTTPLKKIPTEDIADVSRVLYAAEIPLAGLPAGRYLMQVTIIDRTSKQSASQQIRFEIE
ncbi:MAG TPA: VWA domain-containing protein [Pyrinomonadaceae bacterium]|nr:VWA domain-containing protein [Pyrinomonadaceae bacterium]